MNYTLGTASKATGKSKATILRAIQTGKFSAEKDANGVWRIEPSELHRVYPETPIETVSESKDDALVNPSKHLEALLLEERLASAQKEITHLKAQVEDLKAQVEDLKAQVEDLKAQVEDLKAQVEDLKAQVEDLKAQVERLRSDMEAWRSAATQKRLTWRGLFGGSRSE